MNGSNSYIPVITIDGPGGTGKGTLSLRLAKYLGWHFLDSGLLYRVLAYAVLENNVDLNDEDAIVMLANNLDVRFTDEIGETAHVYLDRREVSATIRSERCGQVASQISSFPKVRQALLERQRVFRQSPGLVTDGRDMGTIIFPDAKIKFFLDASHDERAKRRHKQLQQQGINVSLRDVLEDLKRRDQRDRTRQIAPLKPAPDAIIIDTTQLSVDEVFAQVIAHVDKGLK